jgi:DHA3 family tetracycline resistance protein-like MFS transporter
MRRLDAHRVWLGYQGVEAFAFSLGWTVAAVFFVRELGLSPLELVLTGTVMEVAYFLFEVPTGIVADIYSRRTSIVIGVVGLGLAFVWTGVAGGVVGVLTAAALMGFAWTFKSGAADAWLADEVGIDAVGGAYQRGAQAARIGALLGIGAAVGLALIDLRLPIVAGGIVLVALGVALAVVMPERGFAPAERDGLGAFRSMARTGGAGAKLIRARPLLLLMVGIAFFGGMWSEGMDRLWEAHFIIEVGVPGLAGLDPVVWFGVLAAGALVLAIVVAKPLVRRLEALGPRVTVRVLFALDLAMIVGTVGFALAGSFALAVGAFWATRVARSIAGPVYATWLNSNVDDSSVRATVLSMTNLGDSAGEWGGGPAIGALGNGFGIRTALAASAAALVPALALYGRADRHEGREPELSASSQIV